MNEGVIYTLSLWLIGIIVYVVYNLYRKNVKLERMLEEQSRFNSEVIVLLDDFNALVNKIDMTIWVQSDPELRALFDNIKELQKIVQDFTGRR